MPVVMAHQSRAAGFSLATYTPPLRLEAISPALPDMKITCLCPTFQRVELLEEALWCFLQQTHENRSLYICNDDPNVRLVFNDSRVVIENLPYRFKTLFEKRNYMIRNLSGYVVMHWDDDDIYAPWAIEVAVKYKQKSAKEFVCFSPYYKGNALKNRLLDYPSELFSGSLIDADAWILFGGIPEPEKNKGICEEELAKKFKDAGMFDVARIEKNEIFYLWRKTCFRKTWDRSHPNDYKYLPERKVKEIQLKPHLNKDSRIFGYK